MRFPSRFTAGDDVSWSDSTIVLDDGSIATSSSHALIYSLRGPIKLAGQDLTAAADGQGWRTTLAGAATASLNSTPASLTWYWQAVVVAIAGGARATVGKGQTTVLANLAGLAAGAATYDGRSQAERDLAAVKAEISARISGGLTVQYTIGSRSLQKEPTAALLELESRLKMMVAREKTAQATANGLGNAGRVLVRFR